MTLCVCGLKRKKEKWTCPAAGQSQNRGYLAMITILETEVLWEQNFGQVGKPAVVAVLLPIPAPLTISPLQGEPSTWELALSVLLLRGKVKNNLCFFLRLFLAWNA